MLHRSERNQRLTKFVLLVVCLIYTLQAMLRNENSAERLDYDVIRTWFIDPRTPMLQNEIKKKEIFLFVSKFVSRIYGMRMINAWLSKKKGSTFFDLMTISDFAYTVAVLENSYEVWNQEFKQEQMSKTDWEDYMNSEDYIKKRPKFTGRKGKKREYCDSGWSKEGIGFFNDVRQRWKKMSSQNMANAWSDLEQEWAVYAEDNNFGNMYARKVTVTSLQDSSNTPHEDGEGEGQYGGLPEDRFDFENNDCPWKKGDDESEYGSDLGSTTGSGRHTRPQKRARRCDTIGRVSLESANEMVTRRALDFDDENNAEGSSSEEEWMFAGV